MVRADVLDSCVRGLSGKGFKILLDIVASSPAVLRVAEVPYTFRERLHGESKLDSLVVWDFGMLLAEKTIGRYIPVRFFAFTLVGGAGVLVHMAVLAALRTAQVEFSNAQAVATVVAMVFNFWMNNLLTYRDRRLRGRAMGDRIAVVHGGLRPGCGGQCRHRLLSVRVAHPVGRRGTGRDCGRRGVELRDHAALHLGTRPLAGSRSSGSPGLTPRFWSTKCVERSAPAPEPAEAPVGNQTRVRRMIWLFVLAVAVRVVYFMVMAPYTPDWDPKPIQRNGFLTIARNILDGEGISYKELLTYYPVGHLVPTAARSPLPIVVFAGALSVLETHSYYPLLLLAWCCSGVVAACAYWVAARASGREWIGLWTGVVFACYLSEMFITTTYSMASEPLFAACLAVYVVLLIRAADRPGSASPWRLV